MKIDKIIFSSSEQFSPFWNLQAEVWSNMGIEPVLLLWGKKSERLSERYGKIVEMEYSPDAIKSLQLTWSKVHYTQTEPDTTWIIGDIDLYPLQTRWFTQNIEHIPDTYYAHLAETNMCIGCPNTWRTHGCGLDGGNDLTAYYHVAKGKTFTDVYELDRMSLVENVNHILSFKKYGAKAQEMKDRSPIEVANTMGNLTTQNHTQEPYWCADENYSSDVLWKVWKAGKVSFDGLKFPFIFHSNIITESKRVDRAFWDGDKYKWVNEQRLRRGEYIDAHCTRDYYAQEKHLREILEIAGMIRK